MLAMKEKLRFIYSQAEGIEEAEEMFDEWCALAETSEIAKLKTMGKTIKKHKKGILCFWKYDHLTSAGMEGFNNKIRWLIRVAYGYRDDEYFKLKIYDLPKLKTTKEL